MSGILVASRTAGAMAGQARAWRLAAAAAVAACSVGCATAHASARAPAGRPSELAQPVADQGASKAERARRVVASQVDGADLAGPASDGEYKIQVGDELDVKFYFNPDLNEHLTVRPDGRISLQLVPEIVAAGMTPGQLTDRLKQAYASELSNPEVAVIVRTFNAQRVYVAGEVERPGEVRLAGPLTALQAVAMASGFKDTARLTQVLVIRRKPDRTPLVIPVNLKLAIAGADMRQDLGLLPYDVVYVPKSTLANVNKIVDQLLRKNIPVNFGFVIRLDDPSDGR